MRTPILMMLALTVLLGLALGWFTKAGSPVPSHAARGPAPSEVAAKEARPDAAVAAIPAAAAAETAERIEAAATESLRDAAAGAGQEPGTPSEPTERATDTSALEGSSPAPSVRPEPAEPAAPDVVATRVPAEPPVLSPPPRSPGEPPSFAADPTIAAIPPDPEAGELYVVKEGDSLSEIARRRYGRLRDYRRIYEENRDRIVDPNNIYPGQTLLLPNPR